MAGNSDIRVVVYQEENQWFAQALEVDVAAQADTMNAALRRFDATMRAHLSHCAAHGMDLQKEVGPAPAQFEKFWDASQATITPKIPLSAQVSFALCEAA